MLWSEFIITGYEPKYKTYKVMIGNDLPICPHCNANLHEMPKKAQICKDCCETMNVRTRPWDNKKILIKPEQILDLEELWALKNKTHKGYVDRIRRYQDVLKQLKQHKENPTALDLSLAECNLTLKESKAKKEWGIYRNAWSSIYKLQSKHKNTEEALNAFTTFIYIDYNGPENWGEFTMRDETCWSIAFGMFLNENNISLDEAKSIYIKNGKKIKSEINTPIDVEDSWKMLEQKTEESLWRENLKCRALAGDTKVIDEGLNYYINDMDYAIIHGDAESWLKLAMNQAQDFHLALDVALKILEGMDALIEGKIDENKRVFEAISTNYYQSEKTRMVKKLGRMKGFFSKELILANLDRPDIVEDLISKILVENPNKQKKSETLLALLKDSS